jgi:G3E family GTPase
MLDLFRSSGMGPFGRRQRHARGGRIPVTIVTGFLGSGKTTLIRHFLEQPEGRDTAVIVNEFGAVGIDDALLRTSTDAVALLGNGCLCCTTRTDLQIALRRLIGERERSQVPAFGRVVIETSGLADPAPILQTFSTDRALGGECFIELMVTVIDAATALETLQWSAEARKQIILADRLVISKTDLVDAAKTERLVAGLGKLNSHAPIDQAVDGVLDPQLLIAAPRAADANDRRAFVAEAEHSDGIGSFVFSEERPFVWDSFARAMETLVALRGSDLLRVKGFLDVEGCRGPVLIQFVQHLAHPPVELARWPDGDRASRLVFITRDIAEKDIRALFAAVSALAPD